MLLVMCSESKNMFMNNNSICIYNINFKVILNIKYDILFLDLIY